MVVDRSQGLRTDSKSRTIGDSELDAGDMTDVAGDHGDHLTGPAMSFSACEQRASRQTPGAASLTCGNSPRKSGPGRQVEMRVLGGLTWNWTIVDFLSLLVRSIRKCAGPICSPPRGHPVFPSGVSHVPTAVSGTLNTMHPVEEGLDWL